jgi:hypothetical protein
LETRLADLEGGDAGGVFNPDAGARPGEQIGMCLLGMAVPSGDVFRVKLGGGVVGRGGNAGNVCACSTMVAMVVV